MKTKISLLLLAILCNISVFAQSDFDKYFEKKSLRFLKACLFWRIIPRLLLQLLRLLLSSWT